MADDGQTRSSHAKAVDGLAQQESALDRAFSLKEHFDSAKNQQEHQQSRETQQAKEGSQHASQMIREDKPGFRPRPPAPQLQQDKQDAYAKVDKERDNAQERAMKAQEAFKARQHNHDHDHDHEK